MGSVVGKLAICGGEPVLKNPLSRYNSMGIAEQKAVERVVKSGTLSGFYGSWSEEFWGGPQVKAFEKAWSDRFKVKHAISMNSATSGLFATMGAIGIGPGDEVIIPPYTMSATAMAPLIYGGIPVFADIEENTFGLDPSAVRKAITPQTKAIIAVNLFGHPARMEELLEIAEEHKLLLVEDNAQGPLAEDKGRYAGTIGHIGVFSLNYHKHIHTGEGGMCVTQDDDLALRLQLIRNHGENAVGPLEMSNLTNIIGFNFRMTEIQAAIGIEQLKSIDEHVGKRERIAQGLTRGVEGLAGLIPPVVRQGCRHVFYVWAMRYQQEDLRLKRSTFCKALEAEGFPVFEGYTQPLYLLPVFQKKIAIGNKGFPFHLSPHRDYAKGMCPVCEHIYEREFIGFEPCAYDPDEKTLELLVRAIRKVHDSLGELRDLERQRGLAT